MQLQNYKEQSINNWPTRGRHILANFDEDSIVVYQAFNPFIAEYAVANQRYTFTRQYYQNNHVFSDLVAIDLVLRGCRGSRRILCG